MVHERQRLPLGLEAGDHLTRIHPRFDDLESDFPLDGALLLGDEDQAETAFADLLHQPIRSDGCADRLRNAVMRDGCRRRLTRFVT